MRGSSVCGSLVAPCDTMDRELDCRSQSHLLTDCVYCQECIFYMNEIEGGERTK